MNNKQIKELSESLNYLKTEELKEILKKYGLPLSGKKGELIERLLAYAKGKKNPKSQIIPSFSIAKRGHSYPLKKTTLILKGSYKNDSDTRAFFKKIIGDHFHFTAFGQD